jgi:hypothetical protein
MLRKVKATIPCIDWEKGETKMRQQYLIDLDVVVDPLEVAREYSIEKVLQRGARAMTMLGAGVENTDAISAKGAGTAEYDSLSDEKDYSERLEPEPAGRQETPGKQRVAPQTGSDERQLEKERTGEAPKNGRKEMDRDQKVAITKMAARYNIQAETLDRVLAGVKFYDEAAKVISELNKGDISRFLPA